MLIQSDDAELKKLTKYDRIMVSLFRMLYSGHSKTNFPDEVEFDQDDVREAMDRAVKPSGSRSLSRTSRTLSTRTTPVASFRRNAQQCGPLTWLQNGKGSYKFRRTRRKNIIVLPDDLSV